MLGLHLAAIASPGPNTVLVLQCAMRDRKLGVTAALGIFCAGFIWAVAGLFGLAALIASVPQLTSVMYGLCGTYLLWLGGRSVVHSFQKHESLHLAQSQEMPFWKTVRMGLLTNLTNPKSMAYFMSVFTATHATSLPMADKILVVIMMPGIGFSWYAGLSAVISSAVVRDFLQTKRYWLDRIAGLVMTGFGVSLLAALIAGYQK